MVKQCSTCKFYKKWYIPLCKNTYGCEKYKQLRYATEGQNCRSYKKENKND